MWRKHSAPFLYSITLLSVFQHLCLVDGKRELRVDRVRSDPVGLCHRSCHDLEAKVAESQKSSSRKAPMKSDQ